MPWTQNQSPEGESFDLDNVSGSDLNDQDLPTLAEGPTINTVLQVVNNPEPSSTKKNATHDVWYFFNKDASGSVCQFCKYVATILPDFSSDVHTGGYEMPTPATGLTLFTGIQQKPQPQCFGLIS